MVTNRVAIKELEGEGTGGLRCCLPYVGQLTETFKTQRSCVKMFSITPIRLAAVSAAAALSTSVTDGESAGRRPRAAAASCRDQQERD